MTNQIRYDHGVTAGSRNIVVERMHDAGAAMVEAAISIVLIVTLLISAFDILNLFRYSATAFSIAVTAARFGSVESPHANIPTGADADLKIGPTGHPSYLPIWREWAAYPTRVANNFDDPLPGFSEDVLKALNLALGWAQVVLGPRFHTVSNWLAVTDVKTVPPLKNEFWIVPLHYLAISDFNGAEVIDPSSGTIITPDIKAPAEYECCVTVAPILLPTTTICRYASAARYAI